MKRLLGIVTLSLILLCGMAFGGCNSPQGSLSLSFSEEYIELATTDESKDYVITINNFTGSSAKFDFGFDTTIAKVVSDSITYLGNEKFQFSVAPLSAGSTTLRITLRGTDLSISIRVLVTNEITGLSAKENLFLIRGETLVLDSNKFNFIPADTKQNSLKFELAPEQDLDRVELNDGIIYAPEDTTSTEVKIIATSTYNSAISTQFTVKIVSKIDTSSLSIISYGQKIDDPYVFDVNRLEEVFKDNNHNQINLTINDRFNFQKLISVQYNFITENNSYKMDIFASNGIVGDVANGSPLTNKTEAFTFVIGANGASQKGSPYVLTFRIYQADYVANYTDVEVKVNAVNTPTEIRINGQTELSDVELYHNSNQTTSFNFSVYPSVIGAINEDQYKYSIEAFQTSDKIVLEEIDLTDAGLKAYADVEYNGKNLADFTGEEGDNLLSLKNLNGTLRIKPIKDFDKYIAIRVSCLDDDGTLVAVNTIYIKIFKGTSTLSFIEPWEEGVLYVEMPKSAEEEPYYFSGFEYDGGSTLGKLSITPKSINDTVCDIEYYDGIVMDGKVLPTISITPKKVGESSFTISTLNGLEKTLKVIVIRKIEKSDFRLELDVYGNKQNSISKFTVNSVTNSIESIVIKGKNESAYIKEKISNYTDANSYSYKHELRVDSEDFIIENNTKITSVNFTENYSTVNVLLTLYKVEDFILKAEATIFDSFAFKVECVDYIKNMNLSTNNGGNGKTYKSITVHNSGDLPYTDKNLARAYIYLDLEMSDINSTLVTDSNNWLVSAGNIANDGKIGNLGTITFTPYEDNKLTKDYIAVFECNITGINTISSFTVTLKLTDLTGTNFESTITITIQKYINVDFVYLTSAQTEIYLDATEKYKQTTISAYVMPANAMNQEIFVEYPSIVTIEQYGNNITITYKNAGEGILRIFPVSSMKTDSTKNAEGEYYYHIAIKITCADGESEASALKISTFDDLRGIKQNKHYFIDQIINCGGETLYLPSFNGSIRGTSAYAGYYNNGDNVEYSSDFINSSQIGGITNFVVNYQGTNSGLFGELESKAVIYNLFISGSYANEFNVNNLSNIGLLAGFNYGRIYDVQIENKTTETTVSSSDDVNVNMGGMVGTNSGSIIVTEYAKNSTLLIQMADIANISSNKVTLIIGGVAGSSAGLICNKYNSASVGLFGTNANINIKTNAKYIGAVVGNNQQGQVIGIKVIGEIEDTLVSSYVAGLVATTTSGGLHEISNNDIRAFIRGHGTVAGLIAEISGSVDSSVNNNTVQATDNGTRVGINASQIIKYGTVSSKNSLTPDLNTAYELFKGAVISEGSSEDAYGNSVLSYFDRIKIEIPESDSYIAIDSGIIDSYYGDKVYVYKTAEILNLIAQQFFTKGTAQRIEATYTQFALAIYKQAKNSNDQKYIQNIIKTSDILNIAGINANEINLAIDKTSIATAINFGESLNFIAKGYVKLTFTSPLNYKNKVEIEILITNYYTRVDAYLDKDKIQITNTITLINNKSGAIYLDLFAGVYNYKNTPIELTGNNEATFDYSWKDNAELARVNVNTQTVYLTANQDEGKSAIILNEYMLVNGVNYYAEYLESIKAFVFRNNILSESSNKKVVDVQKRLGIENITISKHEINAEPSDNVQISVDYDTHSTVDNLIYTLCLWEQDANEIEKTYNFKVNENSENEGFFYDGNVEIFKLNWTKTQNENHVRYDFSISMVLTKNNYNKFKNETLRLYFSSMVTNESAYINLNYTPETITTVLLNNYSYEENEGMIISGEILENGKQMLEKSKMLNSSIYSSTGDYNVINAYVYTRLSEFDYVDVTLNSGAEGGYLALMYENGVINPNVVYSSNNNILTLRIYRNVLNINDDGDTSNINMLPITILYSLPISSPDGSQSTITFNFYKIGNGINELIFVKDITFLAKSAKKVEFTINDRESLQNQEAGIQQIYEVVKGKSYALNTTIVGFNEDEIYFESSNPNYAYVSNVGGVYYLNITNNRTTYLEPGDENYTPYNRVVISAYGQRNENNATARSRIQRTALNIYEFLTTENLFDDNLLELRVLSQIDIREELANRIALEYDSNVSEVQKFLKSFKENVKIKLISGGIETVVGQTRIESANYILNGYEFKPLVIFEQAPYKFKVEYSYYYHKGVPTCNIANYGSSEIKTGTIEFNVEVYMNSNEEVPLPIYNYQDLLKVNNEEFYRLVSDITIPGSEFTTITKTPLMLDGNGYTITITGDTIGVNGEQTSNFALFETVANGAVFKNIRIKVKNSVNITINNQSATFGANIALLASNNNGTITNCEVICDESINVNVIGTLSIMENSYFGTLVANNNGYITHSRVLANVAVSGATAAGLVANNAGHISSSYVKNSRIANTTSTSSQKIVTGGLVASNNGKITTSFIEGKDHGNKIYSNYQNNNYGIESKILYTSTEVGGFVYQNSGIVQDCYSNIPVVSTAKCAGFVNTNNGEIIRVYSLSKMKESDTLNYAFVTTYSETASFEDCFFAIEAGIINDYTSETNYRRTANGFELKINGVMPLRVRDFNITEENTYFKNFLYQAENNIKGVWFYVRDAVKETEVVTNNSYETEVEGFEIYDIDAKEFHSQSFRSKRLQLVAPNEIATSRFNLSIKNTPNGEEYSYSTDDAYVEYGSKNNPYLISSASDFESYFDQKASQKLEYYRIINNIDYDADKIYSSKLFSKTIIANVEGNNLEIKNYTVNSSIALSSSGLFGTIGSSRAQESVIKNLTFIPKYVNLPNCTYVGGVAGTILKAKAFNISVNSPDVVVNGKNIVGGVFGRTDSEAKIYQIFANVTAKSTYYNSNIKYSRNDMETIKALTSYEETGLNRTNVSYGGSIIGYVAGVSSVIFASIGDMAHSYATTAGLLFGGVGANATVSNISVNIGFNNQIKALVFGGIIAGEVVGTVNSVQINSDVLTKNLFSLEPLITLSVGGVAGIMNGGTIKNISSTKGYSIIGAKFTGNYMPTLIDGASVPVVDNPYVVKYAGGIVGYIYNANQISNINICGEQIENEQGQEFANENGLLISGGNYVGSIAGYVQQIKPNAMAYIKIQLTGHKKYINEDGNEIDECLYTSYVSEASYTQVDYMYFTNYEQHFGLAVGYSDEAISGIDNSSISLLDNIYTYYADYKISGDVLNKVPGLDVVSVYLIGGKSAITETDITNKILRMAYNLATGEQVWPKPNQN